ncbi:cellobiose dehydrogenase [Aspergillus bombycis]|uniref:Cellobiose dehydrogenase n=1 Tax=Aspergillus bombycis TaxID=109264 RepID=A0A1F8A6G3_9EURO|nr:cellobiose dehydrogenase [Aspergillus bombycis]OGM47316.1 cellobiose dehydrogenase [Aspergillus bombycis]
MRSSLFGGLVALSSALGAAAMNYNSSAYSDSTTGIDFQRWCDEKTGFCFGLALPETVDSDFIGQLVVPLSSSNGWGGVSLSSSMTKALLIGAWPNGDSVVSSLREAQSYTNPDAYSGDASLEEIPDGTSINSTHLSYTFLCRGCVVGTPTTFGKDMDSYFFGWALSKTSPKSPASSDATLNYHAAGFGSFQMVLSDAKSAKYSTWASKAKASSTTTPSASASASPSSTPSASVAPTVLNSTYDYIVVGGGPAGIITAERLAETKKKVLLIERGVAPTVQMGNKNALSWNNSLTPHDVPALGSSLSKLGLLDDYLCDDTAGMAGCVLGGGTIVNALAFIHPQEADFNDKWPAGWKWDDVKDAASRLYERNPGSILPSADGKRYDYGMYNVLGGFFKGLGWRSVNQHEQPNEKHEAYGYPSWSVANGIRAGPVRSYLPLAQELDNFSLRLQTKVRRLVRRGGRITGVEVETESGAVEIINIRAGGKVILAAGSMSTPRVLFNSGIGPAKQIENVKSGSTGITVPAQEEWINLPVGENLKDHPMFTINVHTKSNFTAFNTSSVLSGPAAAVQQLYSEGSGVLSEGGHRLQFWTSNEGSDGKTRFYQGSCSVASDGVITMKLYLTHGATSSGVLGIGSSGATVMETDPWLQTDADKEAVTQFLQGLLNDMTNSTAGFTVPDFSSAADIIAKKTSGDHFVGTTKMGTDDGRTGGTSVVDTNAKVYGTENLYVVDASIHPDLPTGNTQAIVMIAAEAAAAKIIAVADSVPASSASVSAPAQKTAYPSSAASSRAVTSASTTPAASSAAAESTSCDETFTSTVTPAETAAPTHATAGSTTRAVLSSTSAAAAGTTSAADAASVTVVTVTKQVVVTSTTTITVLPTFA